MLSFISQHGTTLWLSLLAVLIVAWISAWLRCLTWALNDGWRGLVGAVSVAWLSTAISIGVLFGDQLLTALLGLFPFLTIPFLLYLGPARAFWLPGFFFACLTVIIAIALLCRFKIRHPLMAACLGPSLIILTLLIGQVMADRMICHQARTLGVEQVSAASLLTSVRASQSDWPRALHGYTSLNNMSYGWSYKQKDWYKLDRSWQEWSPTRTLDCSERSWW